MIAFTLSAEFLTGAGLGFLAGLGLGAYLGTRKGHPGND